MSSPSMSTKRTLFHAEKDAQPESNPDPARPSAPARVMGIGISTMVDSVEVSGDSSMVARLEIAEAEGQTLGLLSANRLGAAHGKDGQNHRYDRGCGVTEATGDTSASEPHHRDFEPNTPYNGGVLGINRSKPQGFMRWNPNRNGDHHEPHHSSRVARRPDHPGRDRSRPGRRRRARHRDTGGNENCCFTNPRYSGICEVTTGPDETCSDVLAYLNNQASVGKTYCGNTKIRGGWAQVECEGEPRCARPPFQPKRFPRSDVPPPRNLPGDNRFRS